VHVARIELTCISDKVVAEERLSNQAYCICMLMYCNINQIAAIFVPYLLNDDQQQKQLSVCKNLQEQTRKDRITAEDERWVYDHDEDSRMLRLKLNHR